jgi:peptidylprolyl isomerase
MLFKILLIIGFVAIAGIILIGPDNITGNIVKMISKNPVAVLETNYGVIKIELYKDTMPVTAGNFEKLVEEGFYDGTLFHRVIDEFMIQGGDPLTKDEKKEQMWGTGGPGYKIKDEFKGEQKNYRGTISMANAGPNTGGSQFFINLVNNNYLDGKHPVFGKVIEGMEVVDTISEVETNERDLPSEPVKIIRATIE